MGVCVYVDDKVNFWWEVNVEIMGVCTVGNGYIVKWATNFYNYVNRTIILHTHTRLMALFRDYPGEPVPER